MNTYTDRHIQHQIVTSIDKSSVTGSSGFTAGAPMEVIELLSVGDEYGLETMGGSGWGGRICGWLINGQWYNRKSDQDLEREHQEFVANIDRRHREQLTQRRDEWIGREENLPGWLKERIHFFHISGGDKFELDGWGYELIICELAALYAASPNFEDNDAINEFARREGTSGNQHGMAKALAKAHLAEPDRSLAGTVSALSPLTGNAFYEPEESAQ